MSGKMKFLMNLICLCISAASPAFGLEAPYLISATALSDSTVEVRWRNNDVNTEGFLIQRMDNSATAYQVIDTVNSAATALYIDSVGLKPQTVYTYQLHAYSASSKSDTSNHVQVTTMAALLHKASVTAEWNFDTSAAVDIVISDSSKNEKGYCIYRRDSSAAVFSLVRQIESADPASRGTVLYHDSTVQPNKWYFYRVAAFTSADSVFSETCTTFTYSDIQAANVAKLSLISEFPVTLQDYYSWSALSGDSVIALEKNAPEGKYSVIDFSNPSKPLFTGYADSATLVTYDPKTLIPAFLKLGISNILLEKNVVYNKDRLLVASANDLLVYNQKYERTDSLRVFSIFGTTTATGIIPVNDTVIYITRSESESNTTRSYCSIFNTSSSKLDSITNFEYCYNWHGMGRNYSTNKCIHGVSINGNITITVDYFKSDSYGRDSSYYIDIYNVNSDLHSRLFGNKPINGTSGICVNVSPSEMICVNDSFPGVNIYMSNVNDVRGYQTAIRNNAIYRCSDSGARSNGVRNIMADTASRRIYVVFNSKIVVLGYEYSPAVNTVCNRIKKHAGSGELLVSNRPNSSVSFSFSNINGRVNELRIFDMTGRMIDKIECDDTKSLIWKSAGHSGRSCIAVAYTDMGRIISRFVLR